MKTVVSKQNPTLKTARKLAERKGRDKEGRFLAEGRKLICEARLAGFAIETLFVDAGALAREDAREYGKGAGRDNNFGIRAFATEIETEAGPDGVIALEESLYAELCKTRTPPPLLALMRRGAREGSGFAGHAADGVAHRAKDGAADGAYSVLILDRIADPGNAGTMVRTALAAGMDAVWCVKGTAGLFSDKAIRASAGAVFHMPAAENLSAADCIEKAKGAGAKLVVLAAGGEDIYHAALDGNRAFVVGSEAAGVDEAFAVAAAAVCGIPMSPHSESLNAAAAVAVALYEKARQDQARQEAPCRKEK
ncbi:MAG: RNA methyltransferase [Clostridiales Family XIII bacterium]|nr:RNA methyltransferase [Clostridiales Family XIII bacterium]